jgi:glycosyltransferase involved in cell wall biosynthesis
VKLNLIAPINPLGYGITGLNVLKALQQCDVDVSLFPIGQPQITNQHDADCTMRGVESAKFFDNKAPCLKIWHQHDMAQFVGKGEHIGFPIFELDTFNESERHHLKSCDRLFVCSEWAKVILYNQKEWTSPRVDIVPLGVDANIFKSTKKVNNNKTIFFNCGKWEIRKGHDILIDAFKQVCKECDDVELWMMCSNPFNSPEEDARWANLYNHNKIKLIPRANTQQDVYNIMSMVDCGVFPSRGEGWNLELLEMMSIGKHVIATDYSAHTQFCNKSNCILIPVNGLTKAYDGKWFFGQGNWANITKNEIDTIAREMINFHKNKPTDVNHAGIQTAKFYSWENTARDIIKYAF